MSYKRIFLNFQKKLLFTFIYLFFAFCSKCRVLIFGHKIVSVNYYRSENQNTEVKNLYEKNIELEN